MAVHPQIAEMAARMLQAPSQRPFNLPGMSRDTIVGKPIDQGLMARLAGNMKEMLGVDMPKGYGQVGSPQNAPFFPPGKPIDAVAPGAAGRRFDYPSAININVLPRTYEPIDFETLRAMADPSYGGSDLVRLAIETRKDQMAQIEWSVMPRKLAHQSNRPKADERCTKMEELFRRPDGHTPWQQWCSQLIEEHLVVDAATIYRRRSLGGETIRLELMDGTRMLPLLNYDGLRPEEGPAYKQNLKGFPAVDYSKDDLLYMPRNPRVNKIYGYSCVEQIIVTVNIALRRQAAQLAFYTDGNIPDAIGTLPETWSMQQIAEYQAYWDTMVNDATTRRKMRFIPGGTGFTPTRPNDALTDAFDEWLARVVAYCFSLPPTPFVKMVNRATAESAYDTALSEGLTPLMIWLKGICDYILANWMGFPDLEFVFDSIKKPDPAEEEQRDLAKIGAGVISRDVMRAKEGLEPLGIPEVVQGIGPLGFISVAAMIKAIQNGWDLTGLPPQQPEMPGADAGMMPGSPLPPADGSEMQPQTQPQGLFDNLPPEVLEALGMDPGDQQEGQPPSSSSASLGDLRKPQPVASPGQVIPFHQHPAVVQAFKEGDKAARAAARALASRHRG